MHNTKKAISAIKVLTQPVAVASPTWTCLGLFIVLFQPSQMKTPVYSRSPLFQPSEMRTPLYTVEALYFNQGHLCIEDT